MAFITQFYTWATGNTITAARLNGNISNIIDGLDSGTKDINIAKLQIGGSDVIDGSQNFVFAGDLTNTSSTSSKPLWTIKNTNTDAFCGEIQFYKFSASPADNDDLGNITFYGDDDGTTKTLFAQILVESEDVTDATEDGKITFNTVKAGTLIPSLALSGSDVTMYTAVNDASPQIRIGATDSEEFHIQAVYDSGGQTLDYVLFQTDVASATADKGEFRFNVDGTEIGQINDSGINVVTGLAYYINDTSVLNATTLGSAVVTSSLTTVGALASGSIASGFGNITTGGIIKLDVDGTAENAAGSLTLGAGNDAGIFFDGTNLVLITNGAGASGIILDSEDDTLEIKGSGVLQATFDTTGLNLVTGDAYYINATSVLNATTLGSSVVTSSLTSVGALDSGSITSGFGNITTGGILKIDVDGTAKNAAGSLTLGAGNDAGVYWDGTDLKLEAASTILSGNLKQFSATNITAGTTQTQAGATALTADRNDVSTVANDDDGVKLLTAVAGLRQSVTNNGSKILSLYPNTSDNLGKGVDTAIKLAVGTTMVFEAYDATNWQMVSKLAEVKHSIHLNTGAGHGSSSLNIRRIETSVASNGTALTVAHSSTLGTIVTVKEDGVYSIFYMDAKGSAGSSFGASINSSELTTTIFDLTPADIMAAATQPTGGARHSVSATRYLNAGDIIRPHTDRGPDGTSAAGTIFVVTKIN